ncbi:hypothetical protein JNJ66_06315 [Candidatus Saccharibacteria bacterium]|nr:hypothetical protein [Candidatus Saccharibacteria bacterium]
MKSYKRIALAVLALPLILTAVALVPQPVANAEVEEEDCQDGRRFGRQDCYGFYTNRFVGYGGDDLPLSDEAYFDDIEETVSSMDEYLNGNNRQDNISASLIINLMMGQNLNSFNGDRDAGISRARALWDQWEAAVRDADNRGLIDYDYRYAGPEGYSNSGFVPSMADMYGYSSERETIGVTRFRSPDGGRPFMIETGCGNIVGDGEFKKHTVPANPGNGGNPGNGNPAPSSYAIDGDSVVSGADQNTDGRYVTGRKQISALPGSTVRFSHILRNCNNCSRSGAINYTVRRIDPGGNVSNAPANRPQTNPGSITLNANQTDTVNENDFTIPSNATPGQQYCQHISFTPRSNTDNGTGGGQPIQACVQVAYNYDLVPSASVSEPLNIGGMATFTFTVNNAGQTASNAATGWTIQQIVAEPGSSINLPANYTDSATCALYSSASVTCSQIHDGGQMSFNAGSTTIPNNPGSTIDLTGYPAGTRVCRVLAVDPPTQSNSPRSRWSTPACVITGKYPTVHFMGGDISVGGAYPTSTGDCTHRPDSGNVFTVANSGTNGSVVEYAAMIRGKINHNAGSRRGFGTGGIPGTDAQRITAWRLSFANTSNPAGNLGDAPHCMTDYYARFSPQQSPEAAPSPLDLATVNREVVRYNGDVTIGASAIQPGKRLLVVADGNVTVNGDITYPSEYANRDEIPSIAIVARGDITVDGNVTRLDGSYFSRGTFATCGATGNLSSNICNRQLAVNGAIYTDRLQLMRTYGADDSGNSEPAERFTYGIELLYNNVLEPSSNARPQVVNEQDLPIRF